MMRFFKIFFTLLFTCTLSQRLSAQEVQVPVDKEGKIEYIDAELEQKLGLFTQYSHFLEARLYQVSDSTFVLEISQQPDRKIVKNRINYNSRQVEEFRASVSERIKIKSPQTVLDQDGRTKLIVSSTTTSLGFYSWAVPSILDVNDDKSYVGLYMLVSGAGFYIPFTVTSDIPVTDAAATMFIYGQTRGIAHGIFLNRLFSGDNVSDKSSYTFGMLGSIGESIGLYSLANSRNMNAGNAEAIGICGDFGIGFGLGVGVLGDMYYDGGRQRSLMASLLLSSLGGMYAGNLLSGDGSYTRGDAYVMRTAGLLGAYTSTTLLYMIDVEEGKSYAAAAMIAGAAGIYGGDLLVRDKNFSTGQGTLMSLSSLTGGLVGLGIAFLISSDDSNGKLYLALSNLGAIGGFYYLYNMYAPEAQTATSTTGWNFHVYPEGLTTLVAKKSFGNSAQYPMPLMSVQYTF
jgi:hypothetical protein